MSNPPNERGRDYPSFRASATTGTFPPAPFSSLSKSDSGRPMRAAARSPSGEPGPGLAPFQKTRDSRDSTVSAALGPVPSNGVPSVPSAVHSAPPLHAADRFYQPVAGSYGACGSCRCPGPAVEGSERGRDGEKEGAVSVTRWFGKPWEGSVPLPLSRLRYPWSLHARIDVTVSKLLTRACLRPDLLRLRRVHEAGLVDEAASSLRRLLSEGEGNAYQVPDEIPGDWKFAFSPAEVEYVDRMASALFGRAQYDLKPFVLSEISGLYFSPRPFPYSKARVSLQKSASSLMRLHAVAVAHNDWAAYRGPDEADDRVFRSSSFVGGLTPGDFPALLNAVIGSFPSLGIHPLLPFILKHFGYACADPCHPGRALLQHNCDREWAWSISSAFMCEISVNRRVFVQPSRLLAYLEWTIAGLPNLRLHPLERNSPHVVWTFSSALELMQRASAAGAGAQRL